MPSQAFNKSVVHLSDLSSLCVIVSFVTGGPNTAVQYLGRTSQKVIRGWDVLSSQDFFSRPRPLQDFFSGSSPLDDFLVFVEGWGTLGARGFFFFRSETAIVNGEAAIIS